VRVGGKLTDKGLVLLLLTISLPVEIDVDVVDDRQVVELKVLAPEAKIILLFPSCPGVKSLVQT
jgi:hypothetical protein